MGDSLVGRRTGSDDALAGDNLLAARARGGDAAAFERLVEHHQGAIFRMCRSMLGDRTEAEDAAQETFVRAWQSLPRFDTRRSFGPWLRGIAANVCLQALRRRGVHERRQSSLEERAVEPAAPQEGEVSALAERAVEALRALDETYRLPLTLFYLEDATVADVAAALGLSAGAVRVRLHRGREKLREMLMDAPEGSK